jgi:DNA-binding MarR family transcriptional regulator
MKKLIRLLGQYLEGALSIPIEPRPWEKSSELPQYLRACYRFFYINVLGTDCVLMADTDEGEQTPSVIGKHMDQVRSRHDVEVVYVRHAVTSYNRKRLIEQKVPFIVPGNQMYLPSLGIDLREHLKRLREKKTVFSPSTQALLLHVLLKKETEKATPAVIAQRLGYSAMTMTRAFDELETAGIGEHSIRGKERHLHFAESGKPIWEKVLPYLNTPVRKRLYVASSMQPRSGCLAGQSALARYTLLSEPKIKVFAFSPYEWKTQMQQGYFLEIAAPEPGAFEIELWKYAPAHFAQDGTVDRLSLYLSLKDSADERVQSALDVLLGEMEW